MFTAKVKGWCNFLFSQLTYIVACYIHCILIVTCLYNIILYVPLNLNPRIT